MYRNQSDDNYNVRTVGYVNHAMETSDDSTNSSACSTTAMVVNQQKLYHEMMYKKTTPSTSCKCWPLSDQFR